MLQQPPSPQAQGVQVDPIRVQRMVRLYDRMPNLFSDDDLYELEEQARAIGLDWRPAPEQAEFSLRRTVKQAVMGFVGGFTTLQSSDLPENTYEEIARSLGSVAGFMGFVPGPGLFAKGGAAALLAVGSRGRAAQFLQRMAATPNVLNVPSIPILAGSAVARAGKQIVERTLGAQAATALRSTAWDAAEEALRLGTASAVSSWQGGVDAMFEGSWRGALEGAGFRVLSNATNIGKALMGADRAQAEAANTVIRVAVNAAYGGVLSNVMGDSFPLQLYHTALGAFFGIRDIPLAERNARMFLDGMSRSPEQGVMRFFTLDKNPEFAKLSKEEQEIVRENVNANIAKKLMVEDEAGNEQIFTDAGSLMQYAHMSILRANMQRMMDEGMSMEEAIRAIGSTPLDKFMGTNVLSAENIMATANAYAKTALPDPEVISRLTKIKNALEDASDLDQSRSDHEIPASFRNVLRETVREIASEREGFDRADLENRILAALDGKDYNSREDEKQFLLEIQEALNAQTVPLSKLGQARIATVGNTYVERTQRNVQRSAVTWIYAADYDSKGTQQATAADPAKIILAKGKDLSDSAKEVADFLKASGGTSINVAGNRLSGWRNATGIDQEALNRRVYDFLFEVKAQYPELTTIITGGQTGTDTAGAVAGKALGLEVDILARPSRDGRSGIEQERGSVSTAAYLASIAAQARRIVGETAPAASKTRLVDQDPDLRVEANHPFEYRGKVYESLAHAWESNKSGTFNPNIYNLPWTGGRMHRSDLAVMEKGRETLLRRMIKEQLKANPSLETTLLSTEGELLRLSKPDVAHTIPRILMDERAALKKARGVKGPQAPEPYLLPENSQLARNLARAWKTLSMDVEKPQMLYDQGKLIPLGKTDPMGNSVATRVRMEPLRLAVQGAGGDLVSVSLQNVPKSPKRGQYIENLFSPFADNNPLDVWSAGADQGLTMFAGVKDKGEAVFIKGNLFDKVGILLPDGQGGYRVETDLTDMGSLYVQKMQSIDEAIAYSNATRKKGGPWVSMQEVLDGATRDYNDYAKGKRGVYEVSSAGDKRFSAFYAQLNDGRYIEDIYQLDIKGNGKAKPKPLTNRNSPVKSDISKTGAFKRKVSREQSFKEYKELWRRYLDENPALEADLKEAAAGKRLNDQFATTTTNQARALDELLTERDPDWGTGAGVDLGAFQEEFKRQQMNIITALEQLNGGIPMEQMIRETADGTAQFVLRPDEINKRMQPFMDGGMRLGLQKDGSTTGTRYEKVSPTGMLRTVILQDVWDSNVANALSQVEGLPSYLQKRYAKDGSLEDYLSEVHLDGVVFARSDLFDAIIKDFGFKEGTGTLKTVFGHSGDDGTGVEQGFMIGKMALFRSDDSKIPGSLSQTEEMARQGLHLVMYKSTAKQLGRRKALKYQVDQQGQYRFDGNERYEIPMESFRVNPSSSEDIDHMMQDTFAPRQFISNPDDPVAVKQFYERFIKPSIFGTPQEQNRFLEYKLGRTTADSINLDQLPLNTILEIAFGAKGTPLQSDPLYMKLWRRMLESSREIDPEEGLEESSLMRQKPDTVLDRILEATIEDGTLSPAVIHGMPFIEPYAMRVINSYVIKRALTPKMPHSGSSVLQPTDPHLQLKLARLYNATGGEQGFEGGLIPKGNFLLGDNAKSKRIKWLGEKESSLDEAWSQYVSGKREMIKSLSVSGMKFPAGTVISFDSQGGLQFHNSRGQKIALSFGSLSRDQMEVVSRVAEMDALLHFAVVRVPADSSSGTRSMRFAGFSGRRGVGMHVSPDDMIYLGGADLDIDKAFWVQNPDGASGAYREDTHPIRSYMEKNANQWTDKNGVIKDQKEGKLWAPLRFRSDPNDPMVEGEDVFARKIEDYKKGVSGSINPLMQAEVARGTAQGQLLIGPFSVTLRRVQAFFGKYAGKNFSREIKNKTKAEEYKTALEEAGLITPGQGVSFVVEGQLKTSRVFFDGLRRTGMNFAVDAANYAGLNITREDITKLLGPALMDKQQVRVYDNATKQEIVLASKLVSGIHEYSLQDLNFGGIGYSMYSAADAALSGRDYETGRSRTMADTMSDLKDAMQGHTRGLSAYYDAVDDLSKLDIRLIGDGQAERMEVAPWLGEAFEKRLVPALNRLRAAADEGDALSEMVLDHAVRIGLHVPEFVKVRDAKGKVVVNKKTKKPREIPAVYDEAWKLRQDAADVFSVLWIHGYGARAIEDGATLKELQEVAVAASLYKDRLAESMGVGKKAPTDVSVEDFREANRELQEKLSGERQAYRNALEDRSPALAAYFDAYTLTSLAPQLRTFEKFWEANETFFKKAIQADLTARGIKGPDYRKRMRQALTRKRGEIKEYWWRTNSSKLAFGMSTVDQAVFKDYFRQFTEVVGETFKPMTDKEAERLFLDTDMNVIDRLKGVDSVVQNNGHVQVAREIENFGNEISAKILKGMVAEGERMLDWRHVGRKKAQENLELYNRLQGIFRSNPQLVSHFYTIFEGITSEGRNVMGRTVQLATHADVKAFVKWMDNVSRGEQLKQGVSKWDWMIFPERLGENLRGAGFASSSQGNPAFKVLRRIESQSGVALRDVRVPLSHFEVQQRFTSSLVEQASSAINEMSAIRSDMLAPFDQALGSDADLMIEFASALREAKKGRDAGAEALDHYRLRWIRAKKHPDYNRIMNTTYFYRGRPVKGKELLGHEAMQGVLNAELDSYFARIYNTLIFNKEEAAIRIKPDTDDPAFDGKWNKNLPIDAKETISHFLRYQIAHGKLPNVGLDAMMRVVNEYRLRYKVRFAMTRKGPQKTAQEWLEDGTITPADLKEVLADLRADPRYAYKPIGEIAEGYWPHNGHREDEVKAYYASLLKKIGERADQKLSFEEELRLKRAQGMGFLEDGGVAEWIQDALLGDEAMGDVPFVTRPAPLTTRSTDGGTLPGWEGGRRALETYERQLARGYYNGWMGLMSDLTINNFRKESTLPKKATEAWAKFAEMYAQRSMGLPTVFPKRYFDDKLLNLRSSPYFWLSDHNIEEKARKISPKWFKDSVIGDPKSRMFSRKVAWLSQLEGKVQLMSLLANTRSMVYNHVGGNALSIVSAGFKPWLKATDMAYLQNINPEWKSMRDVERFVEANGGMEAYITQEATLSGKFSSEAAKRFLSDAARAVKSDPWLKDGKLVEIARKHGLGEQFVNTAAIFMRYSERAVRRRSFLAHYIHARQVLEASNATHNFDDPALIQFAQKGVWATQFLYNQAARPAFAATSLGRVLSRFQMWSMNAMRLQRDIFKDAVMADFKGRSNQRFERMMQAHLFTMGLASMVPFSMFDAILPAPWNYFESFIDYFFGDEEERDKAFFGAIPYPFSPVSMFMAPAFRYITVPIGTMLSGDLDTLMSYQIWTMFPFGLMARNLYNTAETPSYAVENFTGFPMHQISREVKLLRDEIGAFGLPAPDEDE